MKKFQYFKFLLLFIPLSFLLCSHLSAENQIKIGALMPLTGEFAMQAAAFREGLELAVSQSNENGLLHNYQIRLIVEDTQSNPKLVNSAAKKLIEIDRIVAALTTSYPETAVGGALFENYQIPSIALWDSSPQIDAMGEYIFAIGPWTPSAAECGAKFAYQSLHAQKVVIINTNEEWSELLTGLFIKDFELMGGKIVGRFSFNPGDADFRSALLKAKKDNVDLVYAPLADQLVPFHKQAFGLKIQAPILSTEIVTEEHISKAPAAFEGLYLCSIQDPQRAETREMKELYRKKYQKDLTLLWYVATGYDAMNLLIEAIRKVGPNSKQIKEVLYQVRNYPGAAQSITISKGGSSPYFYQPFQVQNGKYHPLTK